MNTTADSQDSNNVNETTCPTPIPDRIRVVDDLTIYTADAQKQVLLEAIVNRSSVTLDLREVAEFDSAGAQLLLLLHREAEAAGNMLSMDIGDGPVREVLSLYRLLPLLEATRPREEKTA